MSILTAVSNSGPDGSTAIAVIFMMVFWVAYAGAFMIFGLVSLAASVLALVSLYRNRDKLRAIELAAWVGICLLLTILGPLSWFLIGRRKMLDDSRAEEQSPSA
ncbi:PLDc N-terminal domain-containing protein [Salinibacterium sp. SWN1162]|uniref:PLDc N-terminal domain-containing protein n=1 Tax=Salinibacterium sp. SWN1162 TaxID=2792053 RepID=UPI0018CF6DD1|nr:PLDc N-terminal domain-containing protein [Salinibacterium sp. SWN1162]MBH0009728.1 PLDc N-terminal domain-containing protein [Salinibacterium sp. SWN1162]